MHFFFLLLLCCVVTLINKNRLMTEKVIHWSVKAMIKIVQKLQFRIVISEQDFRICWNKSICEHDKFLQAAERESVNGKGGYWYLKTGFYWTRGLFPSCLQGAICIRKLCQNALWCSQRFKQNNLETSLVAQWLRFLFLIHGAQVWSQVRELRSHMLCSTTKK